LYGITDESSSGHSSEEHFIFIPGYFIVYSLFGYSNPSITEAVQPFLLKCFSLRDYRADGYRQRFYLCQKVFQKKFLNFSEIKK